MPLPNTANLNEIVSFLEETVGFNQNAELSSVIGSPTTPNDNIASQILTLQSEKETLATNLTSKGQASIATEDLSSLVQKVSNINTGSRVATGFVNRSGSGSYYYYRSTSSFVTVNSVTASLPFRPRLIVVYNISNRVDGVTTFFSLSLGGTSNFVTASYARDASFDNYLFRIDSGAAYVNETGFRLPIFGGGTECYYFAVE